MNRDYFVLFLGLVLGLVFFSSFGFCANSNVYTNSVSPEIEITIIEPPEVVIITNASLFLDGEEPKVIQIGRIFDPEISGGIYSFNLSVEKDFGVLNFSKYKKVVFDLKIVSVLTGEDVKTFGSPKYFNLVFDNVSPSLVSPAMEFVGVKTKQESLGLRFSEDLKEYFVYVDGDLVESNIPVSNNFKPFSRDRAFNLVKSGVSENPVDRVVRIVYTDLAGNTNESEFTTFKNDEPFLVSLVTREQDSKLNYFYDSSLKEFLESKIWYTGSEVSLTLKTNRRAECFFTKQLVSFNENPHKEIVSEFDSADNLVHTYKHVVGSESVWVMCQDLSSGEKMFLSEVMGLGKSLVGFSKFSGGDLSITNFYPVSSSILTTNYPSMSFKVSNPSICSYSLDLEGFKNLSSVDKLSFGKDLDFSGSSVKSHSVEVRCFDKYFNKASVSASFSVDESLGIRVVSVNPAKYLGSASSVIEVVLSEVAPCKYKGSPMGSDIAVSKVFTASGLVEGSNVINFSCVRGGVTSFDLKISLVLDSNAPKVENLSFVNNGKRSSFLGPGKEFKLGFDYVGLIPLEKVFVNVSLGGNKSVLKVLSGGSGKEISISGVDLSNASVVKVVVSNAGGRNSTEVSLPVKFDLVAPSLSFDSVSGKFSCSDGVGSGCGSILYGVSNGAPFCNPSQSYSVNRSVSTKGFNFICGRATDLVGNVGNFSQSLVFASLSNVTALNVSRGNVTGNVSKGNVSEEEEESVVEEEEDLEEPFVPEENLGEDSGSDLNLVVVFALAFVLIGISGGGYFAYRKGYLDKQLYAMGLKKRKMSSQEDLSSAGPRVISSDFGKFLNSRSEVGGGSYYEKHLNKVGSFIDSKISSNKRIFDKFESSSKNSDLGGVESRKRSGEEKDLFYEALSEEEGDGKGKGGAGRGEKRSLSSERSEEFEDYSLEKRKKNS